MSDPHAQLRIADLLRQREEQFAILHRCEKRIASLLGGAYPFPPLPPLPSQTRPPRRRPKPAKTGRPTLRALLPDEENAYHIRYTWNGQTQTSFCTDATLLRKLLADPPAELAIDRVATARLATVDSFRIVKVLWQASAKGVAGEDPAGG